MYSILKNKKLFEQFKFGTHIHNIKLENGIKYQPVVMQGYICEQNTVQNYLNLRNKI